MSEHENGQAVPINRGGRSKIPSERWEQIKTAHASGIGLREIARYMGIPEGTVLASCAVCHNPHLSTLSSITTSSFFTLSGIPYWY
jgi:hypothetical protein